MVLQSAEKKSCVSTPSKVYYKKEEEEEETSLLSYSREMSPISSLPLFLGWTPPYQIVVVDTPHPRTKVW